VSEKEGARGSEYADLSRWQSASFAFPGAFDYNPGVGIPAGAEADAHVEPVQGAAPDQYGVCPIQLAIRRFSMAIKVGDTAPDFKLACATGETQGEFQLSAQQGKNVVIFFYALDFTPV
jgi:hypothetical protein